MQHRRVSKRQIILATSPELIRFLKEKKKLGKYLSFVKRAGGNWNESYFGSDTFYYINNGAVYLDKRIHLYLNGRDFPHISTKTKSHLRTCFDEFFATKKLSKI